MASQEVLREAAEGFKPWDYMMNPALAEVAREALIAEQPFLTFEESQGVGIIVIAQLMAEQCSPEMCEGCPVSAHNISADARAFRQETEVICGSLLGDDDRTQGNGVLVRLVRISTKPGRRQELPEIAEQTNCKFRVVESPSGKSALPA
jgi:hypothetical protein